jgi:hypothetical protein
MGNVGINGKLASMVNIGINGTTGTKSLERRKKFRAVIYTLPH